MKSATVDDRHLLGGVDLAPTILEAAGLPVLGGTEGALFFVPLLRGRRQSGARYVFSQIDQVNSGVSYPMRAVTGARYGYIFNGWADGKTEMRIECMVGLAFPAMRVATSTNPDIALRVSHFLLRTKEELYDYSSDPYALHNLSDDSRHQAVVRSHRDILLRHMKESVDPRAGRLRAFHRREALNGGATI